MFKNIFFPLVLITILMGNLLAGETTRPVFLNDLRCQAMGGVGILSAEGSMAYNYNPALLAKGEYNFTLLGIHAAITDDFFDVLTYMDDNRDNFAKLDKSKYDLTPEQTDNLINELRLDAAKLDNIWSRGRIVPSMGMNIKNFAVGFYNITNIALKTDIGILVPKIHLKLYNDMVFALGYGKYYTPRLAVGANLKIIRRNEAPLIKLQIEEINGIDDTYKTGKEEFENVKAGYGIDLGAIYQLNEKTQLGVVLQDFLGQIDQMNTPMNLKLGVQTRMSEQIILAAGMDDFFNRAGDHLFKKFHLGAEYRIPIFRFRAGISQGYPTAGVGLDFKVLRLNYTYFQSEAASAPGQKSEDLHMVGLKLVVF